MPIRTESEWEELGMELEKARLAFLKACLDGQTRDIIRKAATQVRRRAAKAGVRVPKRDDLEGYDGKVSVFASEDRRSHCRHNPHDD